jgi:alpha-1,3-rhamnosyl/mannosyltransferase
LKLPLIISVDALTPPLSGIGRYSWELASRLPLTPSVDSVRYIRQGRWIENPAVLLDAAYRLPRKSWLQRKEPKLVTNWRLKKQCRRALFHGPNYFLPDYADISVATVHDLSVFRFPETHPVERVKQFEANFTATLARAKHLITDTEAIRREVIAMFGWPEEQISAVPLGVGSNYRPHGEHETRDVLARYGLCHAGYSLCVATIEPRKNIDLLLDTYGELPSAMRNQFPLVLIGSEGWQSGPLHDRIRTCCVEGWLHYLKFVSEADLPILYAGARLFVYPSRYEGFGLPVLEAMASGVPVIASTDPALAEVGGDATLLITPDDRVAFTLTLEQGLEDGLWRDVAQSKGLARAQRFTWEACVEETARVYQKVL